MVFYLVGTVDSLLRFIFVGCIISFIIAVIWALNSTDCYSQEEKDESMKTAKRSFLVAIILAVLLVLIPNSQTITKMTIAQQVTPNNINSTGEVIEKGIDIISDKVIEVIKEVKK